MPRGDHASLVNGAAFEAALQSASTGVIDGRGLHLTSDELGRLFAALPEDPSRSVRRQVVRSRFDGATFTGVANFDRVNFTDPPDFDGATFTGAANFDGVIFSGGASFEGATFAGGARFSDTTFMGNTSFREAIFSGGASFYEATFTAGANFYAARFEQERDFGPVLVYGWLAFDRTVFAQPVTIRVSARRASLDGAILESGGDLFVRWAQLSLEDADFRGPSLVTQFVPSSVVKDPRLVDWPLTRFAEDDGEWMCRLGNPPEGLLPRVVSLRRAKVAHLTLAAVDLRACRFQGAHGLAELRLERVVFASPPAGWRTNPAGWRIRWTRRQTLAEEHLWRHKHGHGSDWYGDNHVVQAPRWQEEASESLAPQEIAGLYRALRKGREDNKDEAGAADFYYGEMEMRRQRSSTGRGAELDARPGSWAERRILLLYWLVAGYGLRASRALIAFAITVLLLAVGLDLWGFRPDKSYGRALLFALESSVSLLRAPTTKLTAGGEVLQIILRLAGPLCFGLAILSLRGRVKR